MKILIDDTRDLQVDIICRTSKAAMWALSNYKFEELLLDHDLRPEDPLTGYDILKWSLLNDRCPPKVRLITANPDGWTKMRHILTVYNYTDPIRKGHFIKGKFE